jgi:phosphoglycolate phosphatase-like HAD superfamily hydrolase
MIGSTISDIKAAKSAGISSIMINNHLNTELNNNKIIIDEFDITNAILLLYEKSMY